MNNRHVLTLSDIKVDKVPDGYIYLTKDADWMHGVQLGMLEQFSGTVSFDLPAGVNPDDFDSVVIWCKRSVGQKPSRRPLSRTRPMPCFWEDAKTARNSSSCWPG